MVKPLYRNRARQALDGNRMASLVRTPGIDPRTWVALGVVTEIGWDNGMVIAVRFVEGALAGEEVACDVATPFASALATASCPLEEGDTVVTVLLNGDANNMPIVLGALHTASKRVPATINGVTVDAALAMSTILIANTAAPAEVALKSLRLTAGRIQFGPGPSPTQPFVRGQAFADGLDSFLEELGVWATALIGACTTAGSAITTEPALAAFASTVGSALADLKASIATMQAHLVPGDALSEIITGE